MKTLAKLVSAFKAKSDSDLEREIAELKQERRALARSVGRFKEDGLRSVTGLVEDARQAFANEVAGGAVHGFGRDVHHVATARLLSLFVASSPAFESALLAAIEDLPAELFPPGTRAEHERELAKYDERIQERQVELERRRRQAVVDEAQAELANLGT